MRALGASAKIRTSFSRPLSAAPSQFKSIARLASTKTSELDFPNIDAKWQQIWRDPGQWMNASQRRTNGGSKGKYYVLPMFPYPSGALHLGHFRVYTISDVIARYRRMKGYDVLHPIGWDAFGLPAENAAIERGIDPRRWTLDNIAKMKEQILSMGGCWNWEKELLTCDPSFYAETQRIFLRLYKHGLAYQAESVVNYDPVDKTVLANEQVDSNGFSWRSGAKAEKISLRQWFFRITAFQDALLDDLSELEKHASWPHHITTMQKNWLGKSQGASLTFALEHNAPDVQEKSISVFTTRPDTLFGVQYLALSIQHPIVKTLAKTSSDLRAFIDSPQALEAQHKAGLLLKDVKAYNPLREIVSASAAVAEPLPVYVAPYVLAEYGSGAVMGVPAHDARDFEFWRANQGDAKVAYVVERCSDDGQAAFNEEARPDRHGTAFVQLGRLTDACGKYTGLQSAQAGRDIVDDLCNLNQSAQHVQYWRLRDWLISRQRYWGTPIPIVHCDSCGAVPVPEEQLPVVLPQLEKDRLLGKGGNPLEKASDWFSVDCPQCHGPARRETDTMDTFVDSSWYYFRFAQDKDDANLVKGASSLMPVDVYIGGVEHAILHLLYARFIAKFLALTGLWQESSDGTTKGEPFRQLIAQGMVHGLTFTDSDTGRFLKLDEVDMSVPKSPIARATGKPPRVSFEKMSKSKHNGTDPSKCMQKYGADATRAHILFQAPIGDILDWDEDKITGVQRWFRRVHQTAQVLSHLTAHGNSLPTSGSIIDLINSADSTIHDDEADLWMKVQSTIVSVDQSLSTTYSLNTVVSDLMQLTNALSDAVAKSKTSTIRQEVLFEACTTLLRMMSPIVPSFAEECWEALHLQSNNGRVFEQAFPEPDGSLDSLRNRSQPCAVQVNGRLKFVAQIPRPPDALDDEEMKRWVLRRALESPEGAESVNKGKWKLSEAKKIIIVRRGRTVNVVT